MQNTIGSINVDFPIINNYLSHSGSGGIYNMVNRKRLIGYLHKGTKYFYKDNNRLIVKEGELFYLDSGTFYTEDVLDYNGDFHQLFFHYSMEQIWEVFRGFISRGIIAINDIVHTNYIDKGGCIIESAWKKTKTFFNGIIKSTDTFSYHDDEFIGTLKLSELIYLIIKNKSSLIRSRLLDQSNSESDIFRKTINDNTFNHITIKDLAAKLGLTLSRFKSEFNSYYTTSPHRWFVSKRLQHARILLITTNLTISEISAECCFSNTSHFIKLFKQQYSITPMKVREKSYFL